MELTQELRDEHDIGGENYKGFYVMYEDIPDLERFMKIINEKCPDLKLRK